MCRILLSTQTLIYITIRWCPLSINADNNYQRKINKLFADMIKDTIEAYFDDMLVKSNIEVDHQRDLERAFARMRFHNVRLNPSKCAFGVKLGNFLCFIVSQRGIEINPEKLNTFKKMRSPTCHKEVQCLNGCLAALGRFLSKTQEKSFVFCKCSEQTRSLNERPNAKWLSNFWRTIWRPCHLSHIL